MEWARAVRALNAYAGGNNFALLLDVVDKARSVALSAKTEFAEHVAEHGC